MREQRGSPASFPAVIGTGRRRRRPTGAPPPLPKSIGLTGMIWLALMLVAVVAGTAVLRLAPGPLDRVDAAIMRALASLREPWLTSLARGLNTLNSDWTLPIVGLVTVVLIAAFRRWRHLVLLLAALAVLEVLGAGMYWVAARPRAYDVTILAGWQGYSTPSIPVAALTAMLIAIAYSLVVPGRFRYLAKWAIAVGVVGLGLVRVYLGVDHPSDVVFAALLGVSVPMIAFRAFAPPDVYPVAYGHRGKAAHLDVTGARGAAIERAMSEQLGLTVLEAKPVGLEGSGGSTPLKLLVEDDEGRRRHVFAKLYARSHVRADRWYKLGRTMLYGRLEDETPFGTVRRFVEYEDYTLRLLGELGFPTPRALGIVEITPEREYMIVMEFFDDAVEIGNAEIDGAVIDQGLELIRRMWDQGLAHRDVKPANLMVRDRRLLLIDVFFVQVRPSPWRQAVDLGNMMLVLALRSDADTVYEHALRYFTADELAEAFAATRGVASPTQLQVSLKRDGRDLLARFRALAPHRDPIRVQRWSFRRIGLISVSLVVTALLVWTGVQLFFLDHYEVSTASCDRTSATIPVAQAVPTAEQVPCITELPLGWSSVTEVENGRVVYDFTVMQRSSPDVTVTFARTCEGARQPGVELVEVTGGCVVYRSTLPPGSSPVVSFEPEGGLAFVARQDLVDEVARAEDLTLCGAGAPPCA